MSEYYFSEWNENFAIKAFARCCFWLDYRIREQLGVDLRFDVVNWNSFRPNGELVRNVNHWLYTLSSFFNNNIFASWRKLLWTLCDTRLWAWNTPPLVTCRGRVSESTRAKGSWGTQNPATGHFQETWRTARSSDVVQGGSGNLEKTLSIYIYISLKKTTLKYI